MQIQNFLSYRKVLQILENKLKEVRYMNALKKKLRLKYEL